MIQKGVTTRAGPGCCKVMYIAFSQCNWPLRCGANVLQLVLPLRSGRAGRAARGSAGKGKCVSFCFVVFSERPDLASFENGDNSPIDFLRIKEWEHV